MKISLTSDVELWSWNKNFEQDVKNGVLKLVELAEREKIPVTLFISLSDKGYFEKNYIEKISELIKQIKSKIIDYGIHTHCKNIPMGFPTIHDNLKDYKKEEMERIVKWYKNKLEKITKKKVFTHRAGSYAIPNLEIIDEVLGKNNLTIDSSYLIEIIVFQ